MTAQRTLADAFSLSGAGLHEGTPASIQVQPAPENSGFVFVRTDLPGAPRIAYSTENLGPQERRTQIVLGNAEVHTCEHLVAGLFGVGVDNALIEIDGPEPPASDGSALEFAQKALEVGTVEQSLPRRVFVADEALALQDDNGASVSLKPCEGGFKVNYTLDYGAQELPPSEVSYCYSEESFARDIAGARTFCLEQEAKALQAMGFGKGATTQNTLVVGADGPIENTLRWEDEYARHKVLDLIGDLALAGCRIQGHVRALQSGHKLNQRLAKVVYGSYER